MSKETSHAVVGVYSSFDQMHHAIRALETSDFPSDQVSLASPGAGASLPQRDLLTQGDKTEPNAAQGAGSGALVGMLLAAPLLTVPGVGAMVVVGPLLTGLTGAVVGGLMGAMSGWGVEEDQVQRYEARLREGCFLVVAHGDPRELATAQRALRETDYLELKQHPNDVEPAVA